MKKKVIGFIALLFVAVLLNGGNVPLFNYPLAYDGSVLNSAKPIGVTGSLSVSGIASLAEINLSSGTLTNLPFHFKDDPTTGIVSTALNSLSLVNNGVARLWINVQGTYCAGAFYAGSGQAGKAAMSNLAPTASIPVFIYAGDTNSGLGRRKIYEPSIIASGTEVQSWCGTGSNFLRPVQIGTGSIAGLNLSTLSVFDNSAASYASLLIRYSSDNRSPGSHQVKSRGTTSASLPILLGDGIWTGAGSGNNGASVVECGKLRIQAAENFTATSTGSILHVQLTPLGTTTQKIAMGLDGLGNASFPGMILASGGVMFPDGTTQVTAGSEVATFTGNKAIVGSLTVNGNLIATGQVTIASGSGNGIVFDNDPNSGVQQVAGGDSVSIMTAGTSGLEVNASYVRIKRALVLDGSFVGNLITSTAGSVALWDRAASSTEPTFGWYTNTGSTDSHKSGLGRYAVGQPCMIASGSEIQRWTPIDTQIFKAINQNIASGGRTTYQGNAVTLTLATSAWSLPLDIGSTSIPLTASNTYEWEAVVGERNNTSLTSCVFKLNGAFHTLIGSTAVAIGSDTIESRTASGTEFGIASYLASGNFQLQASGTSGSLWQVKSLRLSGL